MKATNSSSNSLQRSLARLHEQLSAAPRLDNDSKRLLREVLHDIEGALQEQPPKAQAPRSRLEELAVSFDAGHPTLSASIREIVDLLGRAGL